MDALVQDFKAAARALRARKGFVALAVGTLALALGANSSVFGVIHAVLLEQLPYRDPERLAILWNVKADGENEVLSVANFEDYQAGAGALWSASPPGSSRGSISPGRVSRSASSPRGSAPGSSRSSAPRRPWGARSAWRTTAVVGPTWSSWGTRSGGAGSAVTGR